MVGIRAAKRRMGGPSCRSLPPRISRWALFPSPLQKRPWRRPGERTVLYYHPAMGLPDTSPVPKKDSMGMDYIPVYEGGDSDDGSVTVSPGKLQRTGGSGPVRPCWPRWPPPCDAPGS